MAELLAGDGRRAAEMDRKDRAMHDALMKYETRVVLTSRDIKRPEAKAELEVVRSVSSALVGLVKRLCVRPDFGVGKGGIASSDIDTYGLGVLRAVVWGQVGPGAPVWQLGEESMFPGLGYVICTGNVGTPAMLLEIVSDLLDVRTAN